MEIVEAHDESGGYRRPFLEHVEQHLALAVLRHRHSEQIGDRGRHIDRADPADPLVGDGVTAGQEGRPHVHVGGKVLHVGDVAVLAEERRRATRAPGVAASNWYGG